MQADLDGISDALRIPGNRVFGAVNSAVRKATGILNKDEASIVAAFAPDKKEQGTAALAGLKKVGERVGKLQDLFVHTWFW